MNLPMRRLGGLIAVTSIVVGACGSSATPAPSAGAASASPGGSAATCATGSITAAGSTALQPLVDAAARQYQTECSGATISVQGGGSGTGLTQVLGGTVQIGDSDIFAAEKLAAGDASQLSDHQVVRQGWVMVLNKGVTGITNLTSAQARDIWTGKVTNWKDVGGNDQAIVLILRPASSGTRATFKKVVLGGADEAAGTALTEDSNGAVAQAVKQTTGSTSVIGIAYYQQNKANLTSIQLDGVDATLANLQNGTYKLQAFGHMYTKGDPSGLTKAFIDYFATPEALQIAAGLFFAPPK